MKISEKYQALLTIRSDAQKMIKNLQLECPHDQYTAKYEKVAADYANDYTTYYWVELHCPDCKWHKSIDHDDEKDGHLYYASHPRVYDEYSKSIQYKGVQPA